MVSTGHFVCLDTAAALRHEAVATNVVRSQPAMRIQLELAARHVPVFWL